MALERTLPVSTRTYIASLGDAPDLASATRGIEGRANRKVAAATAMRTASEQVAAALAPRLDALQAAGLVTDVTVLPYVGAALITVPDARAADAYHELAGLPQLRGIRRDRSMRVIDDPVGPTREAGPGTAVPEYNVARVNAPAAWAAGVTGQGIVIGSIDTGANVGHEALKARYRGTNADGSLTHDHNYADFVDRVPTPQDPRDHGSHTIGTMVGGTADRIIGIAPGARFIAARGIGLVGRTKQSDLLASLNWMIAPTDASGANPDPSLAPDIVSNSWGYPQGALPYFRTAVTALAAAGIVPVFAAGNEGPKAASMRAPATYPEALSVAATDANDAAATFSSRGPGPIKTPDGSPVQKPDVAAPGVDVLSATGRAPDAYMRMSGTSMAAPAVSGVAALLLSKYPNLTVAQVRQALTASAKDLGDAGPDTTFGYGRVDAAAALAWADTHAGEGRQSPR